MTHVTELTRRAVIAVTGADARNFLNGLLTVDVLKLNSAHPRYAALLSPQGKFLHDLFLMAEGERILIDVERARMQDLLGRLKLYKLRADVRLEETGLRVFACWDGQPPPAPLSIEDPRLAALGSRVYAENFPRSSSGLSRHSEATAEAASLDTYDAHRIALGVPEGSMDMIPERSLIMECGFEALHGVDFDKGCYVGQEVTARSKFRASLRKQFYVVRGSAPLQPGMKIMQGNAEVGDIRSVQGFQGLAMLNNDAARAENLTADGTEIAAELPVWAKSGAGESAGTADAKGVE